jgi:hypothetical protein
MPRLGRPTTEAGARGKTTRIRTQNLRAVYRLIGECRELGDDPTVWGGGCVRGVVSWSVRM